MKRVSALGLIHKNSILLCRRAEFFNGEPMKLGGYWGIFAGSIEKNEGPMYCAIRELKEESQIELKIQDINYVKTLYLEGEVIMHIYMAEVNSLVSPVLDGEHTEYGWFEIDSLDSFPYDIDKNIVECIKKYKKNRFPT
jgi:8-oxo-dGTP pyrophosphatase MutT (NUDIX family)